MEYQLILPDIGEGIVEAEVQKWYVAPGDSVREDQPLVEVMTDKATVAIPSPHRGKISRLLWREGEVAIVHQPLLVMELEEAPNTSSPSAPDDDPALPAAPDQRPAATLARKVLATPAVRSQARRMGIELEEVIGSGPGGRVTQEDLLAHSLERDSAPPSASNPEMRGGEGERCSGRVERLPFRGLRRRIAETMTRSRHTAAHFTFVEQLDATELVKLKERMAVAAAKDGVRLTFLPFFVKGAVAALKRHPMLNASLDEAKGELQLKRWYDIGIASATDQGLVVPVIRRADQRSLLEVAREIERLSAETKAGRVRPEDLGGSTFTLTSLGAMGGLWATPIINPPEVAILGIHRIRPTPVVREGQIVVRDVMHLSLSFDHRVIDGHVGAAFAYTLIEYLEDPALLFMEMT